MESKKDRDLRFRLRQSAISQLPSFSRNAPSRATSPVAKKKKTVEEREEEDRKEERRGSVLKKEEEKERKGKDRKG